MSEVRTQTVITLEGARRVLDAALTEARRLAVAVVIHVCDPTGETVMSARMDGAPLLSVGVARDKAWTVAAFGQPTHWWAELIEDEPSLAALGNGRPLMPVPGGVPIIVAEKMVGAIGVSGATAEEDRRVAEAGAAGVGGS